MVQRIVGCAVVLAALACPGAARASCAAGVGVDGHLLLGTAVREGVQLPAPAGAYPAIAPGCNDGGGFEPDRRITVLRMRGVPPTVGVLSRDRATVYFAPGALLGLRRHPLHALVPTPPPRRGRCRPVVLRGKAAFVSGIDIRLGEGSPAIHLDGRTRLTNRPVTQPVALGQRLRIAGSRCGRRRFADRIAFAGATVPVERFVPHFEPTSAPHGPVGGFPWPAAAAVAAAALAAAALLARLASSRP
jgi:hypothetical protein